MKRLSLILAIILAFTAALVSCTKNASDGEQINVNDNNAEYTVVIPEVVNVAVTEENTAIGLVRMMADSAAVTTSPYVYDFRLEADTDAIIAGKIDIAAVSPDAAALLYNSTDGDIAVLSINTLGSLYIVENGITVNTVEDLRGKTLYVSSGDNVSEYMLRRIVEAHGLEYGTDVFVEFRTDPAECLAAILKEAGAAAMLPQPFIASSKLQNEDIRIALDINKEWQAVTGQKCVSGVTVVRKEFLRQHPEAVKDFLEKSKSSADYVNTNTEDSAALAEKYGFLSADIARNALPYCGISYIDGNEMKKALSEYLTVLYELDMQSFGGELPGDDFYYIGTITE